MPRWFLSYHSPDEKLAARLASTGQSSRHRAALFAPNKPPRVPGARTWIASISLTLVIKVAAF
jgi:hypothetical protein